LSKNTKVLHIISSLGQGGAERQLLELLSENNNHAICMLIHNNYYAENLRKNNILVYQLGMKSRTFNIGALFRLNKIIKEYKPDIIHAWMYHSILIEILSRKISFRRKIPLIWGIRCSNMKTSFYSKQLKIVIWACKIFSKSANMIINNSYSGRDFHQKIGFKNCDSVISNGIDTNLFAPNNEQRLVFRRQWNIPLNSKVLLCVARVDIMKDHGTLIKAFSNIKAIYPDLTLILAGLGTEIYSNKKGIIALGSYKNIRSVYTASDVIISSSAFGEGFSNALGEGMSAGLIPISTNVGDSQYIIDAAGIIIPSKNVSKLTEAIKVLIELNSQEFLIKKEEARNRVSNFFSKEKMIKEYSIMYMKLKNRN
jgi:glycosyltransferase involved in cell wall biosynthesis